MGAYPAGWEDRTHHHRSLSPLFWCLLSTLSFERDLLGTKFILKVRMRILRLNSATQFSRNRRAPRLRRTETAWFPSAWCQHLYRLKKDKEGMDSTQLEKEHGNTGCSLCRATSASCFCCQ